MIGLGAVGLDVFYGGFSLLTVYGPQAGINGGGMGVYHLPPRVEFPRAPNRP
jgi:hypothetical protein